MSATGKTEPNGFTLIEMLVVLAILGLVSAIGYPAMERAATGRRFALAVTQVESRLYTARAAAIASARPVVAETGSGESGIAIAVIGQPAVFYPDGSASSATVTVSAGARQARFAIDQGTGEIARLR